VTRKIGWWRERKSGRGKSVGSRAAYPHTLRACPMCPTASLVVLELRGRAQALDRRLALMKELWVGVPLRRLSHIRHNSVFLVRVHDQRACTIGRDRRRGAHALPACVAARHQTRTFPIARLSLSSTSRARPVLSRPIRRDRLLLHVEVLVGRPVLLHLAHLQYDETCQRRHTKFWRQTPCLCTTEQVHPMWHPAPWPPTGDNVQHDIVPRAVKSRRPMCGMYLLGGVPPLYTSRGGPGCQRAPSPCQRTRVRGAGRVQPCRKEARTWVRNECVSRARNSGRAPCVEHQHSPGLVKICARPPNTGARPQKSVHDRGARRLLKK